MGGVASLLNNYFKPSLMDILSMRTAATLNSGILDLGSRASLVRRFAGDSLKWKGMKTRPLVERSDIFALAMISPRREETLTKSLSPIFRFFAS